MTFESHTAGLDRYARVMVATPIGVFALVLGLALGTGTEAEGILGFYLLLNQGVLLVFVLACYALATFFCRVSFRVFPRAAARPRSVGIGTRSSYELRPTRMLILRRDAGFPDPTLSLDRAERGGSTVMTSVNGVR
ncbi:MAG: cation:dicarboxylase symporter family transporter [Gemmatimonadetes bacterium]|nr:cation:dicarboxylase symporter family transporter [Gemmatimonadota bacterium]